MRSLALLSLLTASFTAFAQPAPLPEFQLERFRLNNGSGTSYGAPTGDQLNQGQFYLLAALHYERNPLVLFRDNSRTGALVAYRLSAHIAGSVGLTPWLQVGGELPIVLNQGGGDFTQFGVQSPQSAGLGSFSLGARLLLLAQQNNAVALNKAPFDLTFELTTALPFGVGKSLAIESGWNVRPALSFGRDLQGIRLGGEVAAALRFSQLELSPSGLIGRDRIGHQLNVKLLGTTTGDSWRLEGSAHLNMPLASGQTPIGIELLVGGRIPLGPLNFFLLGGPGFGQLPGTPTYRILGGLSLQYPKPGPAVDLCAEGQAHTPQECPDADDDKDGVTNFADQCPLQAEDQDNFEDNDGCPEADNDNDGIADAADACPVVAGVADDNGCPVKDTDGDGVEDKKDKCPTEAGLAEREGCPIRDLDKDGVEDPEDKCPTEAGPKERQGCPFKDRDNDGVEDSVDNCPDVVGVPKNQGCPSTQKQLVEITREKLVIKDKVYFATNKSAILAKSFNLLNQVGAVLKSHPEIMQVTVEGHTDTVGNADHNRKLSQDRAESVRTYLINQGVAQERLKAVGYGPDRPASSNATATGRADNRRVEFVIDGGEKIDVKVQDAP